MSKERVISLSSYAMVGSFLLYICLRDGLSSLSFLYIIIAPLFIGLVQSLLMGIIAPEMVESEPDRYGDSDGDFY